MKKRENSIGKVSEPLLAAVIAYASALVTLPALGWVTTLPLVALLSLLAVYVVRNRRLYYLLAAVFPLAVTCLFGESVLRAAAMAVCCVLASLAAALFKRALYTAKKTKGKDASVYKKSRIAAVAAVVMLCVLSLAGSGFLPVWLNKEKAAKTYVSENFSRLETGHTVYQPMWGRYVTELTNANERVAYIACGSGENRYRAKTADGTEKWLDEAQFEEWLVLENLA